MIKIFNKNKKGKISKSFDFKKSEIIGQNKIKGGGDKSSNTDHNSGTIIVDGDLILTNTRL